MAKVKALKSFAGAVAMYKGEIKEVNDDYVLKDLLKAKYVELLEQGKEVSVKEPEKDLETTEAPKTEKKPARKKSKKGDK